MNARAFNWYLQRITGAALLVLLIMHFWVEHYSVEARTQGITYEVVQNRFFRNPWFVAIDLSFLFIALYHGLNGVRNIILDFSFVKRAARPFVTGGLVGFGVLVAYWGVTAFVGNDDFFRMPQTVTEATIAPAR
jgi:succinate dehydrogenase / fumarate reductase, membrane anchor subunit